MEAIKEIIKRACAICYGAKVIEIHGGDTIACPGCKGTGIA